ncbi:hypothetical protein F7725_013650 [Dissostichus mawsoni]|uniref:Uncharacterized protein n=1 Tax=Dissostichus mawsoni TaxID=36200 RepID=A0A7J5YTP1_DISMA|nr:hypothetical protein F7725_013650 [Dissostichus mawsoni]
MKSERMRSERMRSERMKSERMKSERMRSERMKRFTPNTVYYFLSSRKNNTRRSCRRSENHTEVLQIDAATHRGFSEAVSLPEEVGVLEGGGASSQLLRQVPVETLGGAGGGGASGALPALSQLQRNTEKHRETQRNTEKHMRNT